jgi:hypothetical protein
MGEVMQITRKRPAGAVQTSMLCTHSAGFLAALPVNMLMIQKGIRHHH